MKFKADISKRFLILWKRKPSEYLGVMSDVRMSKAGLRVSQPVPVQPAEPQWWLSPGSG